MTSRNTSSTIQYLYPCVPNERKLYRGSLHKKSDKNRFSDYCHFKAHKYASGVATRVKRLTSESLNSVLFFIWV